MSQSMPGLPKKRDVSAHIRISMFDNRVEIASPGGLPRGVTTEDYLSGNLSILRNPVLASVFFRLGIIEQFGTGIRRIKESYVRTGARPRFEITGSSITVILPVTDAETLLDADEKGDYVPAFARPSSLEKPNRRRVRFRKGQDFKGT